VSSPLADRFGSRRLVVVGILLTGAGHRRRRRRAVDGIRRRQVTCGSDRSVSAAEDGSRSLSGCVPDHPWTEALRFTCVPTPIAVKTPRTIEDSGRGSSVTGNLMRGYA
jgi:hypothetical protein